MSTDISISLTVYDDASTVIQQFSSNVDGAFSEVEGSTQQLTASTENLGEAYTQAASQANEINASYGYTTQSSNLLNSSTLSNIQSMNSLAMSGANLYMAVERVENSQVALDRANLNVEKSTQSLKTAQENATKAGLDLDNATDHLASVVDQYGEGSAQAQKAQDELTAAQVKSEDANNKLSIATDALQVSQERADMAQRNFNTTMMTSALSVIPSVIMGATQAISLYEKWKGSTDNLVTSTGGLNSSLGGSSTAMGGASSSGTGLAGTLGLLAGAVGLVTTSVVLNNQRLDDMVAKGAQVSDTEKTLTTVNSVFGYGIGVELGQQVTKFLGFMDESDSGLEKLSQGFAKSHTSVQDMINVLAEMGYSKDDIEKVVQGMQDLEAASASTASHIITDYGAVITTINGAVSTATAAQVIMGQGATAVNVTAPTYGQNEYQTPVGGGATFYAAGGIATKKQVAILAENEPEAVIPLSKIGEMFSPQNPSSTVTQHIYPTVYVNIGSVSSEVDLEKLKAAVSESIAEGYEGLSY